MEEAPMIDEKVLDELRASVGGDDDFVRDLIEAFLSDSGAQLDAIESALKADDAEALVRPAHTLKSSSATVGAMELSAAARALEMAGRSGSLSDEATRATGATVRGVADTTMAALRAWMARAGDP
jgi:HPt (histidine-containing phosphotransfer) domain-containing protein